MTIPNKRVAVLSPVAWRTPPRQYGAWETVASNITEGLVARGWDVTLFATRDSVTRAHLHAVVDRGYEEDPAIDPKVAEYLHISEVFEHAAEFDLIHSHYDFMALSYTRLVKTPVLTTIHGFSSPQIMPVYEKYRDGYFVSISDSDRAPGLNYLATVYNGIDLSLYPLQERGGDHLVFLGRIHPDKGVHLAIEVARLSGLPLLIAGIIQDRTYFREQVEPHLDQTIRYIGPVDVPGKNELFARARALLHLNTIPERFGLVLAEANAAGVPVIAMDLGSCREVIEDGQTGFLVNNVDEAVRALKRLGEIDRNACRQRVQECFSIETMVEAYERVYADDFRTGSEEAIMKPDIVRRYAHNPILTKADIPYPVETVHNAAVVKHENEYIMLFRSHLRTGRSIIGLARSPDGFHFTADPEPFLTPAKDGPFAAYEEFGVEDPRVTQIDGEYLITYSAYSRNGVRIALAKTKDFSHVERISLITEADYRNVVIFPEKFDGLYARLDRPHSEIAPWSIWISYSPDLRFWGESQLIMRPEPYHWDEMKIGPGAPPIKTDQGWLSIYHGVFQTMDGSVYRLGVALHDLQNPAKIIGVGDSWILQPEDPWEITGYVHNVVFTCGAVAESDGTVKIYWGGADTVMCVGEANVSDLVALCLDHGRPAK